MEELVKYYQELRILEQKYQENKTPELLMKIQEIIKTIKIKLYLLVDEINTKEKTYNQDININEIINLLLGLLGLDYELREYFVNINGTISPFKIIAKKELLDEWLEKRAYNKTFSNLEFSNIAKTILEYDNSLITIGSINNNYAITPFDYKKTINNEKIEIEDFVINCYYDNSLKEVIGKLNEYLQVNHKGKSL